MTSEEIRAEQECCIKSARELAVREEWIASTLMHNSVASFEIALQLAVMNEREAAKVFTEMPKPTTTNVDGRYGRTKP